MTHYKFMGWLWILLGGFWSAPILIGLCTANPYDSSAESRFSWWENLITGVLEVAVFVGSAICGLALLRRWRWSRPMTWILGGIWLVFSIMFISGADGPLTGRFLWYGPSLALAVYSYIVLAFVKHSVGRN